LRAQTSLDQTLRHNEFKKVLQLPLLVSDACPVILVGGLHLIPILCLVWSFVIMHQKSGGHIKTISRGCQVKKPNYLVNHESKSKLRVDRNYYIPAK